MTNEYPVHPSTARRRELDEVHIQVGIDNAKRETFREHCRNHGITMSDLIRYWIDQSLAGKLPPP